MNVWIQKHQAKCNFPIGSRVKFGTATGEVVDYLVSPHTCSIMIGVLLDSALNSGMIHYVYANWLHKE